MIAWYFSSIFQNRKILKSNSDNVFPAPSSPVRDDGVEKTWSVFHCGLHKRFVNLAQALSESNADV